MTVNLLDPNDAVLVLIDHQVLSMSFIRTQTPEAAQYNNIALAKAAKVLGIPNVWTSASEDENQDWWMPGLEEINPEAYANRVKRTGIVDAWNDTRFRQAVEATGRRTLIMSGTTNDGCLLYPALNAKRAGYEVYAVLDAGGSPFQASEDAARARMVQAGVIPTATDTVIGEMAGDWSTQEGGQLRLVLGEMFQQHWGGAFALSN